MNYIELIINVILFLSAFFVLTKGVLLFISVIKYIIKLLKDN